jgi:hypothetical protein
MGLSSLFDAQMAALVTAVVIAEPSTHVIIFVIPLSCIYRRFVIS